MNKEGERMLPSSFRKQNALRYIIGLFLLIANIALAQDKPHSISMGTISINDLDGYGWYNNTGDDLRFSTVTYGYSFKKPKNHIEISISVVRQNLGGSKRGYNYYGFYRPYEKDMYLLNLNYLRSLYHSKFLELQGKLGPTLRLGAGLYDYPREDERSKMEDFNFVIYDALGVSMGACAIFHLPFNFFAKLDADYTYYPYDLGTWPKKHSVFPSINALHWGAHIGYQFGGKKRRKKQLE